LIFYILLINAFVGVKYFFQKTQFDAHQDDPEKKIPGLAALLQLLE